MTESKDDIVNKIRISTISFLFEQLNSSGLEPEDCIGTLCSLAADFIITSSHSFQNNKEKKIEFLKGVYDIITEKFMTTYDKNVQLRTMTMVLDELERQYENDNG